MNEKKHTPGNWQSMGFYISARNENLPLPNSQTIARVFPNHEKVGGDTIANAKLIAACPDMFDALQAIVDAFGDQDSLLIDQCKAALSKAKGEA